MGSLLPPTRRCLGLAQHAARHHRLFSSLSQVRKVDARLGKGWVCILAQCTPLVPLPPLPAAVRNLPRASHKLAACFLFPPFPSRDENTKHGCRCFVADLVRPDVPELDHDKHVPLVFFLHATCLFTCRHADIRVLKLHRLRGDTCLHAAVCGCACPGRGLSLLEHGGVLWTCHSQPQRHAVLDPPPGRRVPQQPQLGGVLVHAGGRVALRQHPAGPQRPQPRVVLRRVQRAGWLRSRQQRRPGVQGPRHLCSDMVPPWGGGFRRADHPSRCASLEQR
mmetsp:Transcript_30117/g.75826  ORF Transcript_30117/g.75826 Transcript_30117/m.75826 type:complete len:278 (-) Transcript_30117:258-1091(-)